MTRRGLNWDSDLNSAAGPSSDQLVVKALSAQKSQNNLCAVKILFRSVDNSKIEDSYESIPTLIHQTEGGTGRVEGGICYHGQGRSYKCFSIFYTSYEYGHFPENNGHFPENKYS